MYFEKNLSKVSAVKFIRALDANEQSIQISMEEFMAAISGIDAWEKAKGIRLWKTDEAWGTEIYDEGNDVWNRTGFEEPL